MLGMLRQVKRRWVIANSRDGKGVPMLSTMAGASAQPAPATAKDSPTIKATALPTTRLTERTSPAPSDWPMATPAAVPMPMAEPITM